MNRFKIPSVLLLYCLLASFATGQSLHLPAEPLLQRFVGSSGRDTLRSIAINWKGDIAAVGNSSRGTQGGSSDILFVVFDAQMNKISERYFGRDADDWAGKILALPDGRYAVAGYSTKPLGKQKNKQPYFGKKDGWLLILDEKGNTQRELILGTADDDVFIAATVDWEGQIWLVGNSGPSAWVVKLDQDLGIVWETRLQHDKLPTQASATALVQDSMLFLVGNTQVQGLAQLWVAALNTSGKRTLDKTYPIGHKRTGCGIADLGSGKIAVAGNVVIPGKREDGFFAVLNDRGVLLQYQLMGGREFDQINSIFSLHNDHLLIAGSSASFERGSRRISAWLGMVDPKDYTVKEHYFGSKLNDEALALAQHPDGRLFAVGTTAKQVFKTHQGWIFQLLARSERIAKANTLSVETLPIRYPNGKHLMVEERAVLPISIHNKGNKGQCNLRAEIKLLDQSATNWLSLPGPRSVLIPPVGPDKRVDWGLPLKFSPETPDGQYKVQVRFFQGSEPIGDAQIVDIRVAHGGAPQLELGIRTPMDGFQVGEESYLDLELHNVGLLSAKGLVLTVTAAPHIRVPAQMLLGDLEADAKLVRRLPLYLISTATPTTSDNRLFIRIADSSMLRTVSLEHRLDIRNPTNDPGQPGQSAPQSLAAWVYPNPDNFEHTEIVWSQEEITVQIKIISKNPISKQQFCLEINGQPCPQGQKFDEVSMKGDGGRRTFSQTVRLQEGKNILRAVLRDFPEKLEIEPLHIVYAPQKPNLHILAIGVPSDDLKFTSKDARDFALALASRHNQAFEHIFLDTLLTEERTTKTEILKSLRRLQYRYSDLQILPKDLILVFVSGHGLGAYDGSFRLAASDYDSPFLQETSLDFEHELVDYLQKIPCRKLFLVDACHSGTATGTSLVGLAARKSNLNMVVSSQADEYSYEDETWQNGAFTQALVLGINSFLQERSLLDKNNDNVLDIQELFAFVRKEVPSLIEKKKPKTKTSQRPQLNLSDPTKPIPLFEHKN